MAHPTDGIAAWKARQAKEQATQQNYAGAIEAMEARQKEER